MKRTPYKKAKPAMKVRFLVFALVLLVQCVSLAGLPQPMVVYYGQAKDGFGWPYAENATVILLRGTNECARHNVAGSISPGVNFVLSVPLDDGRDTNRYVATAVRTGEVVTIVVDDWYGRKAIMESPVPAVTQPGDMILVNVTAASDADADGLPDEWEQELIDWGLRPEYSSIWDINAGDDYDGDTQSNGDEYGAGTFAFLDYDYFFIEHYTLLPIGRARLEFLSVNGKVYTVQSTTNLVAKAWADSPYAFSETGGFQTGPVEGDGDWLSFYVPVFGPHRMWRLMVR
jgi:hypothetical protein